MMQKVSHKTHVISQYEKILQINCKPQEFVQKFLTTIAGFQVSDETIKQRKYKKDLDTEFAQNFTMETKKPATSTLKGKGKGDTTVTTRTKKPAAKEISEQQEDEEKPMKVVKRTKKTIKDEEEDQDNTFDKLLVDEEPNEIELSE